MRLFFGTVIFLLDFERQFVEDGIELVENDRLDHEMLNPDFDRPEHVGASEWAVIMMHFCEGLICLIFFEHVQPVHHRHRLIGNNDIDRTERIAVKGQPFLSVGGE